MNSKPLKILNGRKIFNSEPLRIFTPGRARARLLLPLVLLLLLLPAVPALARQLQQQTQQEQQAQPQTRAVRAASSPTGIALQITFDKRVRPSLMTVPGADSEPRGGWHARFARIKSWQPPDGSIPVRAVQVLSRMEGDGVRINVSVLKGLKFHDEEQAVATYLARVGEKVVVEELAQFGIEPFEIAVLRVTPVVPGPPEFINRTQSLVLVNVVPDSNATLPAYKLTLRNLSGKDISACFIRDYYKTQWRLSAMPQGRDGRPLIRAGEIYELSHPSIFRDGVLPSEQAIEGPLVQRIVLETVVFADGTYEGDVRPAAEFRSFETGRKMQAARMGAIFRETLKDAKEPGADEARILDDLRAHLSALDLDIRQSAVDELARDFPALGPNAGRMIKCWIEVSLHGERLQALSRLDAYRKSLEAHTARKDLQAWLASNAERYEERTSKFY